MKKIIVRVLLSIAIVLIASIALLVLSIPLEGLVSGDRLSVVTNTRIPNAGHPEVRAYVARPSKPGLHPAVIMIHEFWGLNADIIGKADALAQEGYVVVAPDLFRGSTTTWVPRAIYQVVTSPQAQLNTDLDAVFNWLAAQSDVKKDRIAIMGFCFGGGTALRYSLSNIRLAATVIFYGSLITDAGQLRALPGPVLGIFGGADQSIPTSQVREFEAALKQANVPAQISIYAGQPHAFVSDIETIRRIDAPGKAWRELLDFLKTNLQSRAPTQRETLPSIATNQMDWRYLLMLGYEHSFGAGTHHPPH